jgi:hypothetical protein
MTIARLADGRYRAGAFAILLLLIGAAAGCATAPAPDYRFDIVQQPVQVGPNAEITIRLVHLPSGEAVTGAVISKSELEMRMLRPHKATPAGLIDFPMEEDVWYLGSDARGEYRFRGNVSMSGIWTLKIWARVPGEAETVRGKVKFRAVG